MQAASSFCQGLYDGHKCLGHHWLHLVALNLKQEKGVNAALCQRIFDKVVCAVQVPCVVGYLCAISALTLDTSSIGLNLQAYACAIPFLPKAASENKIWISVQAEKKNCSKGYATVCIIQAYCVEIVHGCARFNVTILTIQN